MPINWAIKKHEFNRRFPSNKSTDRINGSTPIPFKKTQPRRTKFAFIYQIPKIWPSDIKIPEFDDQVLTQLPRMHQPNSWFKFCNLKKKIISVSSHRVYLIPSDYNNILSFFTDKKKYLFKISYRCLQCIKLPKQPYSSYSVSQSYHVYWYLFNKGPQRLLSCP